MQQIASMATACQVQLPDDIIEDIITRLPAKEAVRCRCLSRFWAAHLSSAAYINARRRIANSRHGPRFFFLRSTYDKATRVDTAYAWSLARPDDSAPLGVLPEQSGRCHGLTMQPCRGLVLLYDSAYHHLYNSHKYSVYNPSTGQVAALPDRRLMEGCWSASWTDNYRATIYETLGLGYDACSQKHKVVRVHYRRLLPPDYSDKIKTRRGLLPIICEVYVVDDTGCWRSPVTTGPRATPPAWVSSYEPSVFAQGHVHWMAQKQKPKKHPPWRVTRKGLIVSFSLSKEAFGVVPLPPRVEYPGTYGLTELKERLCLFTHTVDVSHCRYHDVWLLRDHEKGTWVLFCRINLRMAPEVARFMCCASPVNVIDGGRRILFMPGCDKSRKVLRAFTPVTGGVDFLPSGKGLPAPCHGYISRDDPPAKLYEESVVSPGRPYEDIIFSTTSMRSLRVALMHLGMPPHDLAHLRLVCRSWRTMVDQDPVFREAMSWKIYQRRYRQ